MPVGFHHITASDNANEVYVILLVEELRKISMINTLFLRILAARDFYQ